MADILIDVEVKGNQKVVAAVKNVQTLQSNVKRLSDAMTKNSLTQHQYYKGISQLAEATGKSEEELRNYANTIRRVEREEKKAAAAKAAASKAARDKAKADREAAKAAREAEKADKEAARAVAKHASEMEQIKNKYVPLYAASKQYERSIEELNKAYGNGALTQGQYLAAMNNIDAQLANNATRAKGNTRSMNAVGMAVQQTGYQVGDFLVQVQGGTNAMVAFGQQATQLVGILPSMAEQFGVSSTRLAFIATGLGIAIPLFTAVGAAIMRTREANKDAADSVKTLDDELKSLNTTLKDWVNTKKASQLGLTVEELLGTRGIEEAQEQLKDARKELTEYQRQIQAGGIVGGGMLGAGEYFKSFFDADVASEYEAALRKVIDAENTLVTLRQKQGEEQFKNFSEQRREMEQQLELSQAILVYGKESAHVKNLELQQEIENRKRAIDQQVKAKEITEAQGIANKKLVEDMLRAGDAAERNTVYLRAQVSHQQQIATIQDQVNATRKELRDTYNTEERSLQQQIALNRMKLQFGEDSLAVENLIAQQARENYRLSRLERGIKGNLLNDLMRQYDTNAQITSELNASTDSAKNLADALKEAGDAMASLVGMGSSLDVKIAGMAAQVQAFKEGTNAVVAGASASERAKAAQARDDALAGGNIPTGMVNQVYQDTINKIDTLASLTSQRDTLRAETKGSSKAAKEQEDYVGKLLAEAEHKRKLIGLTEEETRRQEILFQLKQKDLPTDDKRIEQIIQMEAETRKLMEAEQQREQLMNTVTSNIESAFMSVVDGSKSVEDAFRGMLRNIILAIYQQQVAVPAATAIGGLFDSTIKALFSANGNVFNQGAHVKAYANGGVVNRTTAFPMRGGVGIMGEAGPEAIMPLKRGKNGKLGVQMENSGGGAVTIHQSFNFSANGDESVKRIIRGEVPRITEATKSAVLDAKRRGGSYGRAF